MTAGEGYRELGEAAWAWVLGQVRDDEGPWLPEAVAGDEPPAGPGPDRDSVYAGIGGVGPGGGEDGAHRGPARGRGALGGAAVGRGCVPCCLPGPSRRCMTGWAGT